MIGLAILRVEQGPFLIENLNDASVLLSTYVALFEAVEMNSNILSSVQSIISSKFTIPRDLAQSCWMFFAQASHSMKIRTPGRGFFK